MSNEIKKIRVQFGISPWQKTQHKLTLVAPGFVPQGQYVSRSTALWELSHQTPPKMSLPYEKTPEHTRETITQVHASQQVQPYQIESPVETATTITTEAITEALPQEPEAPESSDLQPSEPFHQASQSHEPLSTLPISPIPPAPDVPPISCTPMGTPLAQPDEPVDKPLDEPVTDPLQATLAALSIPIAPTPASTPIPPTSLIPPDPDMQLMEPWSKELLEQYAMLPLPPFYDALVQQEKVASEIRKQNVCLQNVHTQAQQHAVATSDALSGIEEQLSAFDEDISGIKSSIQTVYNFLQDKFEGTDEEVVHEVEELEEAEDQYDTMDEGHEDARPSAFPFSPRFAPAPVQPSHASAHQASTHQPSTRQDARLIQLLESVEKRLASSVSPEVCLMDAMDAVFQLLYATQKMADDIMSLVPFTTGFLKCSKPNWRIQLEKILHSHLDGLSIVRDKLLTSLDDMGVTLINPEEGAPFSPELHKAIDRVPAPDHEHAGKVAQLIRYGYMQNNAPLRYATVAVYY